MFKRLSQFVVVGAVVASIISPVNAQGGGSRSSASYSGGSAGGPGMSGSAVNVGTPSFTMPSVSVPEVSVPEVSPPSGGSGQRPSGGGGQRPSGGGGGGANIPSGSGQRPDFSGSGERPAFGEGLPTFGGGGSFDPTQLQARFGERGTANISLEGMFSGEGSWQSKGGFGATAQGISTDLNSETLNATLDEVKAGMDGGLQGRSTDDTTWTAPSAYDGDMSGVITAQENAQAAAQNAGEGAQEAIDQATQQASAAYDQFWADYYAAVDYTAQAYYDTVTATADYLLQSYYAAVDYTVQVVDYYLAYYEQYAAYCYYYPWDCYSYAYDVASGTYYYVGDTSDQPVGSVTVGDVTVNVDYTSAIDPVPSAEAYQAVVLFANDQLAAVVEPRYAGDATDAVEQVLNLVPDEFEAFMVGTLNVSCYDYYALMTGGVGAVAAGDCSAGAASPDLDLALTSAAAGAYGLRANSAMPTTDADALKLITTVYPKLEGLAFAKVTDVEGMAYTATTAATGLDAASGAAVSVPKIVYAGVSSVDGVPFVYAVVFVGESYVETATAMLN